MSRTRRNVHVFFDQTVHNASGEARRATLVHFSDGDTPDDIAATHRTITNPGRRSLQRLARTTRKMADTERATVRGFWDGWSLYEKKHG